jgi:serralysin
MATADSDDAATAAAAAALLSGLRWGESGRPVTLTYSFSSGASVYPAGTEAFAASLGAFGSADQALVRQVLAAIEAVCAIEFVEVADTPAGHGVLRFGYSDQVGAMGLRGYAFLPSPNDIGGDVWLDTAIAGAEWADYRPGLLLHEVLHALGLQHPDEAAQPLPAELDVIANTVMSESVVPGSVAGALSRHPATPMPLDIAALQALYGAATLAEGDTVYALDAPTFQGFAALWDSGGVDTLDATTCLQGVRIDLAADARSDIGQQVQAFDYVPGGYVFSVWQETFAIAPGAQIENVRGSAFDDAIAGNALDNLLQGGGGDDRFLASAGTDRIEGGAGSDTLVFAGLRAEYTLSHSPLRMTVARSGDPGTVTVLSGIERIEFADQVLAAHGDEEPAAAALIRLYRAALGREPDEAGLQWQQGALDGGRSLLQLAADFMAAPEFRSRFGAPGDAQFLDLLYRNVLDRAPDAPGLAFHLARLEGGTSRAEVLLDFAQSPENQAALAGVFQPELFSV